MTAKPCLDCGTPTASTRCTEHRGYDSAWERLSKKARRMQPWCEDCGSVENLTCDHSPEAWARKAAGKPIRLRDVAVVCMDCNNARGQARPKPLQHNSIRRPKGGDKPPPNALVAPPSREADYTPLGGMR